MIVVVAAVTRICALADIVKASDEDLAALFPDLAFDMAARHLLALGPAVVVAALGYFVDIYDLQLFNLVADQSLRGLGITDPQLLAQYNYTLFL